MKIFILILLLRREIKCILYNLYLSECVTLYMVVFFCFVYVVWDFIVERFFLHTVPTFEWRIDGELSHLLIQLCGERKIYGTKSSRGGRMQHRKRMSFKGARTQCPCIEKNFIGYGTFILNSTYES